MTKYYTRSMTVTLYDGTVKRIKFRGSTPQEAEEKLKEAKIKQSLGKLTVGGGMTFKDWAEQWDEFYAAPVRSVNSYNKAKRTLNKYFVARIGKMKMGDIRPIHIQGCANQLAGSSKALIMEARAVIRDVMRRAVTNNVISINPAEDVQWPVGTYAGHRALSVEERRLFLEIIKDRQEWLVFAIMYGLGLRDNEARALRWGDIDFDNMVVHITAAFKYRTNQLGPPKSKAGIRDLHLPQWLADILKKTPKKSIFVCVTKFNQPLGTNAVFKKWQSLRDAMLLASGVPSVQGKPDRVLAEGCSVADLTPYCLRHNYCTMMAENEVPLKTAQYFMGHSSIEMTASIYTHVTQKIFDTAKEKMDGMWAGQNAESTGHLTKNNQLAL